MLFRSLAGRPGTGIELVDGLGRASIKVQGAGLGSLEVGRIVITDFVRADGTEIAVWGADWQRRLNDRAVEYGGRDLRFRVFGGRWRVWIKGVGINASAVGRGTLALGPYSKRGRSEGTYAIGGDEAVAWPTEWLKVRLVD